MRWGGPQRFLGGMGRTCRTSHDIFLPTIPLHMVSPPVGAVLNVGSYGAAVHWVWGDVGLSALSGLPTATHSMDPTPSVQVWLAALTP